MSMDEKSKKRRDWTDEELSLLDIKDYKVLVESLDTDDFIDRNAATWRKLYSAMNRLDEREYRKWRAQKENELQEWKIRRSDFSMLLENLEAHSPNQELLSIIKELKEKYLKTSEEQLKIEAEQESEEEELRRLKNKFKIRFDE